MKHLFPILQWITTYKKSYFLKDVIAGFTVGIVLVPQAMAYAMIAGLPPVYGLYASFLPLLTYVFMGTSRKVAVGPVAMDSLLVAAGLSTLSITDPSQYITTVLLLAFLVGCIQLVLGILRMGFLVNFLSKPVISGFTSAAAILIICSQVKHVLGIKIPNTSQLHYLILSGYDQLHTTNFFALGISLAGIVCIILIRKWNAKIPTVLLVVVLTMLATYLFDIGQYGVQLVGEVPIGLPRFTTPVLEWTLLQQIAPIALALALVGYLEAISIGKALEIKSGEETINGNQELIALGTSNIMGSFFQAYPVTTSFSRSAVNYQAGAKTNIAALFSVALVVLTLLFLTPLFQYLPKSILASIIMTSVFGLIDISYARKLWKHRKDEFYIVVVTFLVTLFWGIQEGMLLGILGSLLLMVYRTSNPHFAILGNIKGSDYYKNIARFSSDVLVREDLLIIRFDAQLYYGNSSYFKKAILENIHLKGEQLKCVILNAEAINYVDATGADMLLMLIKEIQEKGYQFYIAGAIGPTRDVFFSSGIIQQLHGAPLFARTKEAVAFFDNPNVKATIGRRVAQEHKTSK